MEPLFKRIRNYMNAHFPILYIETFEEDKAECAVKEAAGGREILEWNVRGLFYSKTEEKREGMSLIEALNNFANKDKMGTEKFSQRFNLHRRVLLIKDAYEQLDDPKVVAHLKFLSEKIVSKTLEDANIIIVASQLKVPKSLEHYITILSMDIMTVADIEQVILDFCRGKPWLDDPQKDFLKDLAFAFKGLSEFEIKNILSLAVANDGMLDKKDLALIHEHKKQAVQKSGIMEMILVKEGIDDIGGLENLKSWLKSKAKVFKNIDKAREFGVDIPKGVLIAGLPGCGKSLNAKAAASLFGVPLLRMDMGRLMGKFAIF